MDTLQDKALHISKATEEQNVAVEDIQHTGRHSTQSVFVEQKLHDSQHLNDDSNLDMMQDLIDNAESVDVVNGRDTEDKELDRSLDCSYNESLSDDSQQFYTIPDDISKCVDDGPTQPHLEVYPKRPIGASRTRSFCANWFNRFPWLEYSISYDKVYCFACRHFSNSPDKPDYYDPPGTKYSLKKSATIYCTTGFCRWAKAHERMQRHNSSQRHMEAMEPWLQETLKRENKGACPTNGALLLAATNLAEKRNSVSTVHTVQIDYPLPSKRKRSRPTKKTAPSEDEDDETSTLSWCSCSNCQDMPKVHECICCYDVPQIRAKVAIVDSNIMCITNHPGFASVCLDPWVLQVAYYTHKQEHGPPSVTEEFERYRYIAYCQFVKWCWGILREDVHVPLPSCVVNHIKLNFRSNSVEHPALDDLPNGIESL